jgi:predicted  nucleic acid-binding Zn-ribbon protein
MKNILPAKFVFSLAYWLIFGILNPVSGQGRSWEVMDTASLKEQLEYIHERTLIYENYRAIREDIFQKLRTNAVDSLAAAKTEIQGLKQEMARTNTELDSMEVRLENTREDLETAIKNKDTLVFLGIETGKLTYNTIMWSLVIGLATVLVILFLVFRRDHAVTVHTRKELEETREEFETYKKSSRERYEKLVVSHHNELQKLKDKKMR